MKISFCISTGESLDSFDTSILMGVGPLYAHDIVSSYTQVDNLVVTDATKIREIMQMGYQSNYYTTADIFKELPSSHYLHELSPLPQRGKRQQDMPHNWSPSSLSVLLAAQQNSSIVFLLGYENSGIDLQVVEILGGDVSNSTNQSYRTYQLARIFEWFPQTQFIMIQPAATALPPSWAHYTNLSVDTVASLQHFIAAL